jgi:DNA-binding NtrC family response regulator
METILIVENNEILRETLASYLRTKLQGHRVLTAADGLQALEVLGAHSVSAVLTDLAMPNIDGYKVMAYMKKTHPTVPVIIMTGAWSLELSMVVLSRGRCVQYLEKPFDLKELDQILVEPLLKKEGAGVPRIAA